MRTKILYYHDSVILDYMIPTLNRMNFLRDHWVKIYDIVDCITKKGSNDMGLHLGRHWGSANIIIVGQDNVPTISTLFDMNHCKEDLCVNPCISFPASTDLNRPMLNQIGIDGVMFEAHHRPKRVYYGGTGVSKISLVIQKAKPIKNFDWGFPAFDSHLFDFGFRDWHCHYPIHEHTKTDLSMRHWV